VGKKKKLKLSLAILLGFVIRYADPAIAEDSSGSGFAIANGSLVVTDNHVVSGCSSIQIPDNGAATIVKTDPQNDIAVLRPAKKLDRALRFRSGHPVKLGEEVVVIGYPLRGLLASSPAITTGIVSSLAGVRDDRTKIQISAPVQPGNSGGPVLDKSGNVIGVVVSRLKFRFQPQNVNFAIKASIVTSLLDSYSLPYEFADLEKDDAVSTIASGAVPAVVALECHGGLAKSPAVDTPSVVAPTGPSERTAVVCGRPVRYQLDTEGTPSAMAGLLGVWTGTWNNATHLCGGLIVEAAHPDGKLQVVYVYGPNVAYPPSIPWKQQRGVAVLIETGEFGFRDDQGSIFIFSPNLNGGLSAVFQGRSGQLRATFSRAN